VIFLFSLLISVFSSPASAACGLSTTPCPFSCAYQGTSGQAVTSCCSDAGSCNQFKTLQAGSRGNTSGGSGSTVNSSGKLNVNPEDGCSGGINTALGCIPYETKGFSTSLLSFLIGVVGLVALVVMLIATFMIMTGGSNPEQVKKGKELFTGGVTGILFIIFSVTLLRIIAGDIIQLPGFTN